jgi:hypothetical protein
LGVYFQEYIMNSLRDDAVFVVPAIHGVGLATAGLSVYQDCPVVAIEDGSDKLFGGLEVDGVLGGLGQEYAVVGVARSSVDS